MKAIFACVALLAITLVASAQDLTIQARLTSATAGKYHVALNWYPTPDTAAGYNLYRTTTPGKNYSLIESVAGSQDSFVDGSVQNGTTYYYAVSTLTAGGHKESSKSKDVAVTVPK